jgi:uncharacterized MAPEG superfamily protein
MTIAEWCLLGAVMLYLLTLAPIKALGHRDFDNAHPRDPAFYADPVRKRALGAHLNGVETFPFFAVAVLLAEFKEAPQELVDLLASSFLLARVAFVITYLLDRSTLRTIVWNIAFALNLGLFFLPGYGVRGSLAALVVGLVSAGVIGTTLAALGRKGRSTVLESGSDKQLTRSEHYRPQA